MAYGLQDLAPIAILFVVAGVTIGIGADILAEIEVDVASSEASNAINNSTAGLSELASWLDTIALVMAAALVLGVIFYSFGSVGERRA